ncbi:MAG: LysM peptidoglycan-binding domain-containing protein [Dethiobacter sp.]|nr:LysM peptidoglycan-binding domain-containing protein [Dethiobacter sp.]MCL5981131.1 LysM peptidoglycan-binding domain-containing protein [Bacillota bacterium]
MQNLLSLSYRRAKKRRQQRKMLRYAALFCIWLLALALMLPQEGVVAEQNGPLREVVVTAGDTLWSLSRQHMPRGREVRDYIAEVISLNELTSPLIYPGQALLLP